ncbi:MAG: Stf0 family sulfotransferase [Pseudomonadota bacterium]
MREAGIAELLSEGRSRPLTVVYEDLVADPAAELARVLSFLGIDHPKGIGFSSGYRQIADPISEGWVQRFREEKQKGWQNVGW